VGNERSITRKILGNDDLPMLVVVLDGSIVAASVTHVNNFDFRSIPVDEST
jgi:hypothetical protein